MIGMGGAKCLDVHGNDPVQKSGFRLHNSPCGKIKRASQGIERKGATLPGGLDKIKVDEVLCDSHCAVNTGVVRVMVSKGSLYARNR